MNSQFFLHVTGPISITRVPSHVLIPLQTFLYKLLALHRHVYLFLLPWLRWRELQLRVQNHLILQHPLLGHSMAKWPHPVDHLVKHHSQRPHIYFRAHVRVVVQKTLRRQVPIRTQPLRSQLQSRLVVLNNLAKPEIRDLYVPLVEHDVLRLQVIVNHLRILRMHVSQSR